ncbi:catalase [Amycolatopsis sp., V23-08]|uniref:Catalase-related peroxidase n=1 Tax=Amycolatopsis heterodermiae TaxID=3110235 RepID=A0ABU5RIH0_9PSEU|nr:catalase [Amycolatopsis sp., V23-08]MEA5365389.1 catalase [Amycolatopsis sp., V23-08]
MTTPGGMTAVQAVNRIEAAGHPRPQDRRLHARGAVFAGRFVPSGRLAQLTSAAHLTRETDLVVRFSNGSPQHDADDRTRGIRGMAVKFLDGEGNGVHDLVAANFRVFPSSTPEGFIELVEALAGTTETALKDKLAAGGKLAGFLFQHKESHAGIKAFVSRHAPASFATTRFDGLHAFHFADAEGRRRAFRYRLVPQLGEVDLDSGRALPRDFLLPELDRRLAGGPVSFTLVVQLGDQGDPTHDPSIAWPEQRTLLPAGEIRIERLSPDSAQWERQVFDPTRVAPGVELSDDAVLAFRPHAYSVSAERRLSADPGPAR